MGLKKDQIYIEHIITEIDFIMGETKDINLEKLIQSEILKRAVTRSLEIIGEASKNVSEKIKTQYSDIEWRKIAGIRDKLIHGYFGIDWEIIWDIIKNNLPELKKSLKGIQKTLKS